LSKFVLTAQLQLQAPTNVKQVVSQIQKQLSGVSVNLQMTGSQKAQSQLNQIKNSLDDATKSSSKLGKTFGQQVRRFSALAIATRAVSLFTNTLSSAIQESISFERELIKIAQVTNQTIQQLSFLSKTVSDLSTNLGISSSSLLSVSRILSQAGLSASETSIALSTLAKTELAPTFDNISQTAEGAIAIFNQFKQGAAALEEQLGSINAVAGQFAVESGDLISVVRRTGGVFQAAGGELNELIALFTSVRSTTRESAESIATGLRTIFTRIQRPRTIEFMKKFGVELTDLEGKFVGPYEAVRRLSSALSGLEQGDITFVQIAEELGGFRQIGKVIPLLQQFSVAQEALNVAQRGSGSLARDAATAQQSLAVQIIKVKEQFLELIRGVTETPTFQIMAQSALTLASALIKVAESLKPILPIISAIAAVKFAKGMSGFLGGLAGSLSGAKGFNAGGKVQAFATGGMVPGSGNRDTVPAMLTPGEFVMRKSSVQKIGAKNLKMMNEGGKADPLIQKGTQVGGVGIFDSDMIGAGSKGILGKLKSSGKQYEVIHGPAGSGKTTFATKRFGSNFIKSEEDLDKYSKFVVLSGAGKVKAGGLSPDASSLFSGATKITGLSPSPETVLQRREQRLATGSIDKRSEKALRGTLKAPTTFDQDLYKGFNNVEILEKFADGGKAKDKKNILDDGFTIKPSTQTHFTHLDSGQTSNLPKDFRKVYTNMGLDLPANWNLDWATNVTNQKGAMGSALESYIADPSHNIFDTLTRQGRGSKAYGFKGRSKSQAFSLLSDPSNQSKIRSNLVAAISSSEQFDTDLDVNKTLPNALTTAVAKSLPKEDAAVLNSGLEEQSAYAKEGKSGRRRLSNRRRQQLAQARSLGGVIQKFAGGGKAQEKPEKNFGKIGFRSTTGGELTATYLGKKGRTGMVSARYNNGLYTVALSKATSGYGPMLYDVVMELATANGSMLTSDRNQVSKDAQGVWDYYFNKRNDVTKHPLDPSQWTKNQSLIDPKLYGKKETWPPKTDPAWVLQSGYKKSQRITTDPNRAINLNDPKYANFIRQSQMSYMKPAQKKQFGGIIQKFKDGSTGTGVAPARNRMGMTSAQVAAAEERKRLREKAKAGAGGTLQLKPGVVGGLFLQKGSGGQSGIDKSLQGIELPGFAEGSNRLKASIYTGQLKPEAGQAIRNELKPNITQAVQNAASSSMAALEISPLDIDEKSAAKKAVNKIDLTSIEGYIFEAFTSALTGLQLSDAGATFDYVNPSGRARERVGQLFSSGLSGERLLDAKRTLSTESVQSGKSSIANKIVAGIKGGLLGPQDFQKFATGGIVPGTGNSDTVPASLGVGDFVIRKSSVNSIGAGNLQKMAGYATGGNVSESVPALLTPGEFVFPKKKAQQIGYGKLNRMNKVGKYAKGGAVQRFAGGGKSGGGGGGFLGFGGLTEGLVGVQVALNMLTPTVDENSGTFEKMTASVLSSFGSLVSTITLTQTALSTFGVQLNSKAIGNFLKSFGHAPKTMGEFLGSLKKGVGRGSAGLGDMIGGFQKGGQRTKGESFAENFDLNKRGSSVRSERAKQLVEMRKRNPIAKGGFSKQSALQRKALRPVGGKSILAQLGKKLGASRSIVGRGAGMALRAGSSAAGALGGLGGGAVGAFGASLAAAAGPITAFVTAVKIAGAAISGFRDLENRLKDAIKAEDTATAQKLATASLVEQNWGGAIGGIASVLDNLSSSGSLATDTLAAIGTAFGGTSSAAIKADVAARISSAKTAKALTEAQKASAEAMKDLENGTISASQALAKVRSFTQQAEQNSKAQRAAISTAAEGKSTGALSYGREAMAYLSFGYVDSARQRNEKIDAENEKRSQDSINQRRQAIGIQSQASMATARSILSTGGNIDEVKQRLGDAGPQKLRDEAIEVRQKAIKATKEGDTETAKLLEEEAKMLSDEARALEKSLINLAKEVEKQQKYFAAMNLGLNSATGAAGAFSNAMSNYAAAQEAGNVSVMRSFATLQAGVTSAAAGMDPAVFQKAASEGAKALREFGATKEADKFEANLNAINKAQANAEAGLNSFRNQLKDRSDSGLGLKNDEQKFEGLFDTIVKGSGIGKEMEDQLRDMLGGMDIDYSKIAKGDFSQIEEVFKQLGDETLQQAKAVMEAEQLYQETIRDAAQKRAAAENDFISASRQRQDYQKESREIIASAGGPAFTAQQQREMVVDRYNTGNKFSNRDNLGGATAKDIVAQQNALKQRQAEIQNVRLQAAQGDANAEAKLSGERGVSLSNEESQINQQNQELYNSTKQLIDIKRQEVKIIQEKNRLEKQSMESLLAGDIDSFFDAQASQGAIDALAGGGNVADFDADTLYSAFEELKRQAAAGVTEVNGQQLQGPGGLLERAAAATAEARGLDPAQAALVAQKAAGQTPAEQAANNEIQQLAATLPAFGDMAMNSSRVQMAAAEAQRQAAEIQKEAAVKRSQENAERTLPKPDQQQPPQQQPPARPSTPPPGASPPPAPIPPSASVSAPPPPSGSSSSVGSTPPAPPSSTADIAAAAAAAASQIPSSVNANQTPPTQDPQTIGQAIAQAFSNNARDFASFATAGYVRPSQENESQGVGIRQLANLNPAMALGNMAASNLGLDTQALTSFTSNQLESVSNFGAAVKQFEYIVKAINTTNGSNNTSVNNGSTQAPASNNNSAIGFDTSSMNQFTSALSKFNDTILQSISTLQQTKFTVKLEPTNININLTGTSFLQALTGDLKSSLLKIVSEKIRNLKVDSAGRVIESNSNL